MHTGKQKQMNASYQASLVNRHIRRFTGKQHARVVKKIIAVTHSKSAKDLKLIVEAFTDSIDHEEVNRSVW